MQQFKHIKQKCAKKSIFTVRVSLKGMSGGITIFMTFFLNEIEALGNALLCSTS